MSKRTVSGDLRLSLKDLRDHAISAASFGSVTLRQAVQRIGFVQVDPIRSPAPAQDLILRHRVRGYRAGDIERQYGRLDIEVDRLYAYGFMPRSTWQWLHPRIESPLSSIEMQVLEIAQAKKRILPDDLVIHVGRKIVKNAWGGQSREATLALQSLHFRGFLRVADRHRGAHVYEPIQNPEPLDRPERLRQLVLVVASVLGPLSDRSLGTTLGYVAHHAPSLRGLRSLVPQLVDAGDLATACIDGVRYLWPPGRRRRNAPNSSVRFLAPFDPLVWDRQRFEHLWGWPYRFEAYVPAAKRQLGYYAMPMLWRDDIIGRVNVSNRDGKLVVERGFTKPIRNQRAFEREFEVEVARLKGFLKKREKPRAPDRLSSHKRLGVY